MDLIGSLAVGGVNFGRNLIGIVFRPYETYRRIIETGSLFELPFIGAFLAIYFAIASLVKTAAFRPFLLTAVFMKLAAAAAAGFILVILTLSLVSRRVGGKGTLKSLAIGWAYTLVPTLLWFLATSFLYVMLPPPRTTGILGITFSLVYLVFSIMLFFWKITLGYLTLRFGMRLDLAKIMVVVLVSLPFVGIYSYLMYRLGIFKVPFI